MKKKKRGKINSGQKLHAVKFGIAGGLITALCVFVVTILGTLFSGYASHSTWILQEFYGFLGYKVCIGGALLGAVYGFIDGFIIIWFFAWVYNKLLK
jgi:hypothetical protein